jgi:hypothetical protein
MGQKKDELGQPNLILGTLLKQRTFSSSEVRGGSPTLRCCFEDGWALGEEYGWPLEAVGSPELRASQDIKDISPATTRN